MYRYFVVIHTWRSVKHTCSERCDVTCLGMHAEGQQTGILGLYQNNYQSKIGIEIKENEVFVSTIRSCVRKWGEQDRFCGFIEKFRLE